MPRTLGLNTSAAPIFGDACALTFANVVRMAGYYSGFGSNPSPGYDADGYPLYVNGTTGPTQTQVLLNSIRTAGNWTLIAKGIGTIQLAAQGGPGFDGQSTRTIALDGTETPITLNMATAGGGVGTVVLLRITASTQGNNVRDIRLLQPGHAANRVFGQPYLDLRRGMKANRHLDWLGVNGTTITTWGQASRLGHGFGFPMRGRISEEYTVALANEMQAYCGETHDLWIQLPHFADPTYWQGYRDLIQNGATIDGYTIAPLNPLAKVYCEFSNETDFKWPQKDAMDARRQNEDAAAVATWSAQYANKPYTYTVNGHAVTKTVNFMGTAEYVAQLKAYAHRKFKELFAGTTRTVLTTVMNQGGVPAFGQVSVDFFHYPNFRDGLTTEIDVLGHGLYAVPESGPFTTANQQAMADQYALGGATNQAAAKTAYFNGFPQFFADYNPLSLQYRNLAAFIGAQYAIYEVGVEASSFTAPAGTARTNLEAFHKACFLDDRMESAVATPLLQSFGPEAGPVVWYFDASTSTSTHWSATESAPPNLAISPILRALRADIAANGGSSGGGGGGGGGTSGRPRYPRSLMRLRSTTP